uniref:TmcB/TmcC TPR repeats domain-containing protein n=1 Tax=Spongospora subterranea TaxID=70186 RepID=A0A0H5QHV5_9EUKA|eukprot:CRZ00896.1 hypothetical protein [Spongospora subterranea]
MAAGTWETSSLPGSHSGTDEGSGDVESSAVDSVISVSKQIRNLFYFLSLESFLPFWFVLFSMCLELIQQVSIMFAPSGESPEIPWGFYYTSWIRTFSTTFTDGIYTLLFGDAFAPFAAIVLMVLVCIGAGAISNTLQQQKSPNLILLRTVAISARLLSSTLYIPTLKLLVTLMFANNAYVVLAGIIFSCAHFLFALYSTAALVDISYLSDDPSARFHSRFQITSLVFNTFLVFGAYALQNNLGVFVLLNLIGATYVAATFSWYCPYNRAFLNDVQSGICWTYCWVALAALVSVSQNDESNSGPSFIAFGGTPMVFIAGGITSRIRSKAIERCPDMDLKNPYETERKLRYIVRKYFKVSSNQVNSQGPTKAKKDNSLKLLSNEEALTRIRRILVHGIDKFPESPILPLLAAYLYFTFFKIDYTGYRYLQMAEKLNLQLDFKVLIFRLKKDNERKILADEANRDVVELNNYNKFIVKAQEHDLELTQALLSFWDGLDQETPDLKTLRSLSITVSQNSVLALSLYQKALRIHSESQYVLKTYAGLLSVLLQDPSECNRLLARTKELEQKCNSGNTRRGSTMSFRSILFSDHSSVIVISGNDSNLGEILSVNAFTPQMFGLPEANMVGSNINILMPEPFSSHHDFILRRNLIGGSNRTINQRRNVLVLHHTGYVFDAIIYVKIFIQDLANLCFIGVIELINQDQIQILIDHRRVIKAMSFTALQQFGILQSTIDSERFTIESIFENYTELRQKILSNQTKNRQWTEIVQVIGPTRFRMHINIDINYLVADQFVDILRIAIITHESSNNPDTWTVNKTLIDSGKTFCNAPMNVMRQRSSGKKSSTVDSSDLELEMGKTSKSTSTPSQVSNSSKSSATSSADQHEIAKRRDQVIVFWLRRSIQCALLCVCTLILLHYIYCDVFYGKFYSYLSEQKLNVQRVTEIVTIALFSRKLELLSRSLTVDQTEAQMKERVHQSSATVFAINQQQMSSWLSVNAQISFLYSQSFSNGSSLSLQEAINSFPAQGEQIVQAPLATISDSNAFVRFVVGSVMDVKEAILNLTSLVDLSIAKQLKNLDEMFMLTGLIAFLLVFLMCIFELRPAVEKIFMHSTLIFMRFFELPPETIHSEMEPLLTRVKTLSSAGDQTRVLGQGVMGLDARIAVDENNLPDEFTERKPRSKSERSRLSRIKNMVLSNNRKLSRDSGLITKIFYMITVYVVYFSINIAVHVILASNQNSFDSSLQMVHKVHMQQRLCLFALTEYVVEPGVTAAAKITDQFDSLRQTFEYVVFGDGSTQVAALYNNEAYRGVLFGDLCDFITVPDCRQFASGSCQLGLQVLLAAYSTSLTNVLEKFTKSFTALPIPRSATAVSDLTRQTLLSKDYVMLWRADNEFLFPALNSLIAIRQGDIGSKGAGISQASLALLVVFFLVNTVIYLLFCQPFLQRLVKEFDHSRVLLRLIPNVLRGVKADGHGVEEKEPSLSSYHDGNFEDVRKQRSKNRPPIVLLKLQRFFTGFYGRTSRCPKLTAVILLIIGLSWWRLQSNATTKEMINCWLFATGRGFASFLSAGTATASMPILQSISSFPGIDPLDNQQYVLFGSYSDSVGLCLSSCYLILIGFPGNRLFLTLLNGMN